MDAATTTQMMPAEFVGELIKHLIISLPASVAAWIWLFITILWNAYWPFILTFVFVWTIWELITRNGGFHYNSDNGFSPSYNRFVGSGVFLLFQGGIFTLLTKLFGSEVYVHVWPYPVHILAFLFTGLFLNLVGFWKYWKLPNI